jgi:hypothetical protein
MTLLRTESFVPLTAAPAPGDRADYRVTVVSPNGQAQPFQALQTARAAVTASPAAVPNSCEPRVSVQREGDRVMSIRIQCSCGQVLDLACVYPEPVKAA